MCFVLKLLKWNLSNSFIELDLKVVTETERVKTNGDVKGAHPTEFKGPMILYIHVWTCC